MKAFCFTLTLLCAVQSILAYPRPDFAIPGTVSGSGTVKSASNDLNGEITNVGAGTVTLTSGYKTLEDASSDLQSIGDQIVNYAGPLATKLIALADDKVGPIDTTYKGILDGINDFQTLLDSGLTATIAKITTATGDYISKQFADAFKNVKTTLADLKLAVEQLQKDVTTAKAKAGSANPIPSSIIRQYIPAKTVNAVITQIRNLRARVQLITFVINSSLDNLLLVDKFVIALKAEVLSGSGAYKDSYDAFVANLDAEKSVVKGKFSAAAAQHPSSIYSSIASELTNAKFTSDLQPKLNDLNNLFVNIGPEADKIETQYTTYATNVPNLLTQANLETALGSGLCDPLKKVSKVQIANAGYSDFCFSKYSPRLYAQVGLTIDAFDVCYEKELMRLMSLESIIERIVVQILYNTADLLTNLQGCLAITDVTKEGECFTAIAPYYAELVTKVTAHIATTIKLVTAETKASYNRLGACLYTAIASTTVNGQDISTDADACLTAGPTA